MSLPKRIYELEREIASCDLIAKGIVTDESMLAFQNLLNQSWPSNTVETAQRDLVRSMYYSNPQEFTRYVSLHKNKVRALILWTESKRIAKFFDLYGRVHISWNEETNSYVVARHIDNPDKKSTNRDTGGSSRRGGSAKSGFRKNYTSARDQKRNDVSTSTNSAASKTNNTTSANSTRNTNSTTSTNSTPSTRNRAAEVVSSIQATAVTADTKQTVKKTKKKFVLNKPTTESATTAVQTDDVQVTETPRKKKPEWADE